MSLALRRFPFPYASALALSNDCRTMSESAFDEVYGAFAERSLEIGVTLSFGAGAPCAIGSRRAAQFVEAGLADTIAGLPAGGAQEAVALLDAARISPACYIGSPAIGRAAPLASAGVRYFTDPAFVVGEKFGDALDLRSTIRLLEAFGRFDFDELGDPDEPDSTDISDIFAAKNEAERRAFAVDLFNAPIIDIPGPDGGTLKAFKRYRGPQRPAAPTLADQLRSMFLDGLETAGGVIIVEQRLGELALLGQERRSEQRQERAPSVLTVHEKVALDELASRAADRLLVTLPGRLLDWLELRRNLRFEVDETDDLWLIRLTGWEGREGPLSRESLDGLAFTIPSAAPRTIVLIEGEEQELAMVRAPEPKLDGQDSLYLPWTTRPCPTL